MKALLCLLLAVLLLGSQTAKAHQDPAPVGKAIEDFLRVQAKGLPGQVSYSVTGLDPNNQLVPCRGPLGVSLAPGSRAWGQISLAVRCQADGGWSLFLAARIRVVADYFLSARSITQGQVLTEADLRRQTGDLSGLPAGTITDASQALGHTAKSSIAAGQPLREDMLRQAMVVQQNQSVKVVSKGQGFQVATEGRALNNGVEGQVVQVRLASGQVTSGVAHAGGIVEVSY